ncbi:hypothetical protein DYBT9275_02681 [Dyadobacter sp. CECT 9275]|uniref:Uncharacterized protein n=1 Tax=Dyadobacter helix TaxID=2822344 RepID=A0A916JCM6_9BACT|nr:hypothetical protein DYBT9275_02681 [Dyadobacter sp. CECT 9275]
MLLPFSKGHDKTTSEIKALQVQLFVVPLLRLLYPKITGSYKISVKIHLYKAPGIEYVAFGFE